MKPGHLLSTFSSALLLILSFPRPDIGFLAFSAFVPLLFGLRVSSLRKAFLYGWGSGTLWFFFSYNWVTHSITEYAAISFIVAEIAILLLAGTHGLYVGLFSMMVPLTIGPGERFDGKIDDTDEKHGFLTPGSVLFHTVAPLLVLPSAWVLLEFARSWFPAPFPWLILGTAVSGLPFASPVFELSGVYGVSWWIIAINVLVFRTFSARKRAGGWSVVALAAALSMPVILHPGSNRDAGESLRVGIVQGNLPQELKWEERMRDKTLEMYLSLTDEAAREGARVILWPETAVPFYYQANVELKERMRLFAARRDIHIVFGSPGYEVSGREILLYNRVYHLPPVGKEAFYDKNVLVPFGEYVPFADLLPFIDKMVPGEGEFSRGSWNGPFRTPVPSGALVCFEAAFPSLSRREVSEGSRLLVNVTNDAWFGMSWGPYQHLAVATVRAIENRVPVLRAANTGISAIIDERGQIVKKIPLNEKGYIVADIRTGSRHTFYTRFGDWIVILSTAVLSVYLMGLMNAWRLRKWTR